MGGVAWSGGGRGIVRVDVSGDGGKSWQVAELTEGVNQSRGRAWMWTFWEVWLTCVLCLLGVAYLCVAYLCLCQLQ